MATPRQAADETRIGVCNLCEAICGIELTVRTDATGEHVTGVRGLAADPLSRGHLCPKGVALADVHADPDRLRRPMRRDGDGWREIGWDEAIALAAAGLAGVQRRHGADAVATYLGNPVVHSLGAMTHAPLLVKTLGSRNVYSATSVDQLPQQLMAMTLYGHQLMIPVPDVDRTQYLFVVGANPMASNGSLMTVPDLPNRLRALHGRGGRLVVLDPRRTETARRADEHIPVRPGTDALVLLAMVRTLFVDGLTRPAPYVRGLDAVRAAVEPFTPERAEAASGVPAADIVRLTHELAGATSAAAYGRVGISTQRHATACAWALNALNVLTGNLDSPGGVMFTSPAVDVVGRRLSSPGRHGRWHSRVRGLPESSGELPVSALAEELLTPGEGQVRGVVLISGNPVLSTPDGARLDAALADAEFVVAVDIYLNETTRHADVILPPTSALERDHYDLVFAALAVRNTARFTRAPLRAGPGTRHDWQIFRDLALALDAQRRAASPHGSSTARTGARAAVRAAVPSVRTAVPAAVRALRTAPSRVRALRSTAVRQARLRLSPTRTVDLLLRTGTPRRSVRTLADQPGGLDLGPLVAQLPGRLQTRDRTIDLAAPRALAAVAAVDGDLDGELDALADDELLLIGRRHQRDCNSWLHNTERLTRGRPRHQLLLHPDDAAAREVTDGATVSVTSRVGRIEVEVRVSDEVMPGVVCLPHGYGHLANPGMTLARGVPGASINDLTDPQRLDVSGNAVLNGVPVRVARC